jgi:hypothetical protein
MGLSGIGLWGSDIGGFHSFGVRRLTPELLVRWIQLGAVSGVMRTKADGFGIPDRVRPQIWEPGQLPHWRRWAKLRTQLHPYIDAAFADYRRTGMPLMRHLALAFPADATAAGRDEELLFGPDLLAAPVLRPGARTRRLWLPATRAPWVDLWRSARYDERTGGLVLGRARLLPGGREATLPAPLAELPLLARAGTILPLLPPEVDTLAPYRGSGVVRARDRGRRLDLLAFPRGTTRAALGRDGRARSSERRSGWTLEVRGRLARRYRLQAALTALRRPFRPCEVRLGARRLSRRGWSYDREAGVLRLTFRARRARLEVLRSCRAR